jgi:hypothetical protein
VLKVRVRVTEWSKLLINLMHLHTRSSLFILALDILYDCLNLISIGTAPLASMEDNQRMIVIAYCMLSLRL